MYSCCTGLMLSPKAFGRNTISYVTSMKLFPPHLTVDVLIQAPRAEPQLVTRAVHLPHRSPRCGGQHLHNTDQIVIFPVIVQHPVAHVAGTQKVKVAFRIGMIELTQSTILAKVRVVPRVSLVFDDVLGVQPAVTTVHVGSMYDAAQDESISVERERLLRQSHHFSLSLRVHLGRRRCQRRHSRFARPLVPVTHPPTRRSQTRAACGLASSVYSGPSGRGWPSATRLLIEEVRQWWWCHLAAPLQLRLVDELAADKDGECRGGAGGRGDACRQATRGSVGRAALAGGSGRGRPGWDESALE